jgi:hypothetical protein
MAREIIYSVFVSSTYEDLREERAAVQKALLQLKCMPIGMELFGSADEETWEFIKRQIDDCDYYVVVIADRYGSTAADGLSYTEKEYDYTREIKKPVLAFVHGNRGGIPRDKTEIDLGKRAKLEAFIEKVRRSPVSFFTAPHDLATQVTVSFVNLRERRPAVGFIRADQAPDLKKYTELLEENVRLRAEVERINSTELTVFPHATEKISLISILPGSAHSQLIEGEITWGNLFVGVAELIFSGVILSDAVQSALNSRVYLGEFSHSDKLQRLFLRLSGWRLIDRDGSLLLLTEYGKKQYGLLME